MTEINRFKINIINTNICSILSYFTINHQRKHRAIDRVVNEAPYSNDINSLA